MSDDCLLPILSDRSPVVSISPPAASDSLPAVSVITDWWGSIPVIMFLTYISQYSICWSSPTTCRTCGDSIIPVGICHMDVSQIRLSFSPGSTEPNLTSVLLCTWPYLLHAAAICECIVLQSTPNTCRISGHDWEPHTDWARLNHIILRPAKLIPKQVC